MSHLIFAHLIVSVFNWHHILFQAIFQKLTSYLWQSLNSKNNDHARLIFSSLFVIFWQSLKTKNNDHVRLIFSSLLVIFWQSLKTKNNDHAGLIFPSSCYLWRSYSLKITPARLIFSSLLVIFWRSLNAVQIPATRNTANGLLWPVLLSRLEKCWVTPGQCPNFCHNKTHRQKITLFSVRRKLSLPRS